MTEAEIQALEENPEARRRVIKQIPEFAGLSDQGVHALIAESEFERHPKGAILWNKGDIATDFLIVVQGNVMPKLASVSPVQANQTVGLLPLFARKNSEIALRTGDIVVTKDAAVLRIHYQILIPHLLSIGLAMAQLFARQLADTDEALAYL